jgi:hypothetical protein|tara:strand:+ start:4761 stop:4973 length:213 start_codon:yes stop_codon:yes gene_type:complete
MCLPSTPKVVTPKPAPPPPEKPPEMLEDAVDSTASQLKKKKRGAKGQLGRGKSGVQTSGGAAGSGLTINK